VRLADLRLIIAFYETAMKPQWIVVTNAALARVFSRKSALEPLVPVETLTHSESRLRAGVLAAGRAGRQAADNSHGVNQFEPRSDAHRKEHRRFAKELARRLDEALAAGKFGSLMIFSSNPFIGELSAQLSNAVSERIEALLDRDLSHVGIAELERRIAVPSGGK
jgi:protein required for attachment to host cells